MKFSDDLCIYGQFKENLLKDTNIQAIYPNGDVYSGQHKGGHKTGKGTYIYSSTGLTYHGEWVNNIRQGKGELSSSKTHASGTFKNDLFTSGEYQDEEESIFKTKKDP